MPARSLADLLATIQGGNLPERRRQEFASAVRTAARALGKPPENIPAEARLLASRLKEVAPAAIGISRGRWNNIRSLVVAALRQTGVRAMAGRGRSPLSMAWAALSTKLPDFRFRHGLVTLMRFCSERGIDPEAVDQNVFDAFLVVLEHERR